MQGLTIRGSWAIVFVYDFVLDEESFLEQVTDHTLAAARKVIAVHINYPSRAAQRGRTPAQPSYFLKPSSSLAAQRLRPWSARPAANSSATRARSR